MNFDRPSSTLLDLDWILDPFPVVQFTEEIWEKKMLLISRDCPDYFARLPGLDAVEELLVSSSPNGSRAIGDERLVRTAPSGEDSERPIKYSKCGRPDIHDIYRAYHEGYTVVVNKVHRRSASVGELCRTLESNLHHPVGANLYLTPWPSQGFLPHIDTHDVFILQIHGLKEWHIGDAPNDLPLPGATTLKFKSLTGFRRVVLKAGDTLYLPRGIPHYAVTVDSSSLHLTIGVHVFKWLDFVSEAIKLIAHEKIEFREALSPGFLNGAVDQGRIAELTAAISSALADDALTKRVKAEFETRLLNNAMPAGKGHFRSLDSLSDLTSKSLVARVAGMSCRVLTQSDEAVIQFTGNFVSGPLSILHALQFIAAHTRFTPSEISDELSERDKIDIVTRLISEGFLTIVTIDGG
jgi:ribosomal protein L16 Arg81 hydroxylase